jgi:hypothetical protein
MTSLDISFWFGLLLYYQSQVFFRRYENEYGELQLLRHKVVVS